MCVSSCITVVVCGRVVCYLESAAHLLRFEPLHSAQYVLRVSNSPNSPVQRFSQIKFLLCLMYSLAGAAADGYDFGGTGD